MTKTDKTNKLIKELIDLLKKGNISIEEVYRNPDLLTTHSDFDKAIDILSCLDEELTSEEEE